MAFDQTLLKRISALLKSTSQIKEKKMFGGVCFIHRGNMLCGIEGNRLMVRVGVEQYAHALSLRHATVMDLTGKALKGFIFVKPDGFKTARDLKKWIDLGLRFTLTLPVKKKKTPATNSRKND